MSNIGPSPAILRAYREQSHGWPILLGEPIDNSIDAGATRIEIKFGTREMTITDNGRGCESIEAMLTMGRHSRHESTKLGRYGVGLKETACCLWGMTRIESAHAGMMRTAEVNWEELARQPDWNIPDPMVEPTEREGTSIRFRKIERSMPSDWQRLIEDISYTFTPAIKNGVQITIQSSRRAPVVCTAYEPPPRDDLIDTTISVSGKSARVKCGIVREGFQNRYPGFAYTHHHRVIMRSSLGAGGLSISRIAGTVELSDAWRLSKNKDDVTAHKDELGDAVFEVCRPTLEKAQKQAMLLTSNVLACQVASNLQAALDNIKNDAKAKRRPREKQSGAVAPTGHGSVHRSAGTKQPGDRMPGLGGNNGRRRGSLTVEWMPCEGETVGSVDLIGSRINLNENNPQLASLQRANNLDGVLLVCAAMLVNEAITTNKVQKYIPGVAEDEEGERRFYSLLAKVLRSFPEAKNLSIATA